MISAETLVCRVSTGSAIKVDKLYCSTSPTNNAVIFGDLATWIGAGATLLAAVISIFMAYFAYHAWQTSQKQLKTTRDIAVNDQRVPRLSDFLEKLSLRFGNNPQFADAYDMAASRAEVLRLHDRWTLTYPDIYRHGYLRQIVECVANLTLIQIRMQSIDPNSSGDRREKSEFINERSAAKRNLDERISLIKSQCLDLHNEVTTEDQANESFSTLSKELDGDVGRFELLAPGWRTLPIQLF